MDTRPGGDSGGAIHSALNVHEPSSPVRGASGPGKRSTQEGLIPMNQRFHSAIGAWLVAAGLVGGPMIADGCPARTLTTEPQDVPYGCLGHPVTSDGGTAGSGCGSVTNPRAVDPALFTVSVHATDPDVVTLHGSAGATTKVDRLRVTSSRAVTAVDTASDGSFELPYLPGTINDIFYLEEMESSFNVFVAAIQSTDGTTFVEVTGLGDRDGDDSPDAVDCDPSNANVQSDECPRECGVEICGNAYDEDCDTIVDENCGLSPDIDADGRTGTNDCDEGNLHVYRDAAEICNRQDDDCNLRDDNGCLGVCWVDTQCMADAVCVKGACNCPDDTMLCSDACIDPLTDEAHCGGCDVKCPSGTLCTSGECVL